MTRRPRTPSRADSYPDSEVDRNREDGANSIAIVSRRLSLAIDAQRRLNAHRPSRAWTDASGVGASDPRCAHLTRSHD